MLLSGIRDIEVFILLTNIFIFQALFVFILLNNLKLLVLRKLICLSRKYTFIIKIIFEIHDNKHI